MAGWKSECEKGGGGEKDDWLDTVTSQTDGEDLNVQGWNLYEYFNPDSVPNDTNSIF